MKILIIDDELSILEFLKEGLKSKLYDVDCASDGERGAWLAKTGSYDLVILDYTLPKMNGAQVLKEIRSEKKHLPVIILSVASELKNKQELFSLGADDYLTKPFLLEELLLRIEAVLRRPQKLSPDLYKIDNLTFNASARTVRRAGREIYLTRREFFLLEYFLKNRNIILSRQQILENVWDYNADPFSNSIETHIASLRRKLNQGKYRELIHTFSGRGYKLALNKLTDN